VLRSSDHILSTEALEIDVIMRLGQGRKHGWLWIADSADSLSSAPSLSDVQARCTTISLPIRTAYSNTVVGRQTSGNSGFTRRTLNFTHINQIFNIETCDSNTIGRAGRNKGDASTTCRRAGGHEEAGGGHVSDHAKH
jgi:hypothetical protein